MSKALPTFLKDPFEIIPFAEGGFSTSLSPKDRRRLHQIIRKVHLSWMPGHLITAYECDKLLDAFGPKVQQRLLQAAIDAKVID